MKRSMLLISALILFLAVNTAYFWEARLGGYAMILSLILLIIYIVLLVSLLYQVYLLIREKFRSKKRLISVSIVAIVLVLIYMKPRGIINFEGSEKDNLFVAGREGAANCYTILKLKSNNKFVEKVICFGIYETRGSYLVRGDSIFFSDVQFGRGEKDFYQFAVINKSNELRRFRHIKDSVPDLLFIAKNEFKN